MNELKEIEAFARKNFIPVMLDDTRELLFETVKKHRPRRILEIGTAIGYSGIVMLSASENAKLNTIELDENNVRLAKKNFKDAGLEDRVNIFTGDAREIVPLLNGAYDFIFLDGPKGQYRYFLPYLTEILEVGGVLFADNVLYKGLVENVPDNKRHKHITVARNMKAFLDELSVSGSFATELHRIGDGVTVSVKIK